jgi:hypothetical protein
MFTNRNFGVEIEYTGLSRETLRQILNENGFYCHPKGRAENFTDWSVVLDASVTGAREDHNGNNNGGEVVSPVLSGQDGIDKIVTVARLIAKNGGRADVTCGLHVHVDAADLIVSELKTVAKRYARFESEIDKFVTAARRGNNNSHCWSMDSVLLSVDRCTQKSHFYDVSRYFKLNLNAYYKHGTVEFRQHQGTVNGKKIQNWVKFCVSFVEESLNVYKTISSTPVKKSKKKKKYPIDVVDENNVIITDREVLNECHFSYLGYFNDSYSMKYVLRALIKGFDINTDTIFTYQPSTVKSTMSKLRKIGYKIRHERGTTSYILDEIQSRRVISVAQDSELYNDSNNKYPRYTNETNDSLYNGLDEEVINYYQNIASKNA